MFGCCQPLAECSNTNGALYDVQILVYLFAKINLAQIFPLCLPYGLMFYIIRVRLCNVHKPSLPSHCTVLFTACTCEVVNNKYFEVSWK